MVLFFPQEAAGALGRHTRDKATSGPRPVLSPNVPWGAAACLHPIPQSAVPTRFRKQGPRQASAGLCGKRGLPWC